MKPARRIVGAAVLTTGLAVPRVADADPTTVEWSDAWPRVHLWEAIDAVVLTVGDTEFEDRVPLPSHAT